MNIKELKIYVYVLISMKDGSFHFGQSHDLEMTLLAHNKGNSAFTKKLIPWELIASKKVETRTDALKMEQELRKKKNKTDVLQYLMYNDFDIHLDQ
jgi:putative endonuclease